MIKIGDIVTRISHNKDMNFTVKDIKEGVALLEGTFYRLQSDAPIDDLELTTSDEMILEEKKNSVYKEKVTKSFTSSKRYLTGKILHIDADKLYLERCMELYKAVKVYAVGIHISEENVKNEIENIIEMYRPDIVVITGHDSYNKKGIKELDNYKNSRNFVDAVKIIRKKRTLGTCFVISGACQSHFEALIASGCNYAFSPKRVNIHQYDPAIIAIKASTTPFNRLVDINEILKHSLIKKDGIGGIESYGKMRLLL